MVFMMILILSPAGAREKTIIFTFSPVYFIFLILYACASHGNHTNPSLVLLMMAYNIFLVPLYMIFCLLLASSTLSISGTLEESHHPKTSEDKNRKTVEIVPPHQNQLPVYLCSTEKVTLAVIQKRPLQFGERLKERALQGY